MKNHDLSAGLVKLDYDTTLQALSIAVGYAIQEVRRNTTALDHWLESDTDSGATVTTEWLEVAARKLTIAVETYVAFKGLVSRDQLIITGLTADVVAEIEGSR